MNRERNIGKGKGKGKGIVRLGATAAFGGVLGITSYLSQGASDAFALGIANTVMPLIMDYGERKLSTREATRIDYVTSVSFPL